jgi:hypothetical protein
MQLTLYVVQNKVIVPTVSKTLSGYYLETEPVTSVGLFDPALPEVLRGVLERGNPPIPTPSRANFPKPVVLKYAGAKSWKKFTDVADSWQLTESEGAYMLSRGNNDPTDGAYWGGNQKLMIPLDSTGKRPDTNAIIQAIVSDTAARRAKVRVT